jgi:hypothetical protein
VVLRAVAEQVTDGSLRQWLLEQLPGPDDDEELGYGAWLRSSDQTSIVRVIDLRLMTAENQRLFCDAVKRAAALDHEEAWLKGGMGEFADMVARMERGEPPLSKSDWGVVLPPVGVLFGRGGGGPG